MALNLENIRSVLRPYIQGSVGLSEVLQQLWPLLLNSEDNSELVEAIENLLGLHAAGGMSEEALRSQLAVLFLQTIPSDASAVVSISKSEGQESGAVLAKAAGSTSERLVYQTPSTVDDSELLPA